MKLLKIEFLCISILALILLLGQVRLHFGWYNYSNIRTTIADKDWMGAPYIVKEVNFQNRCFEDGHIFRKPFIWDAEQILKDYPFFLTTLKTPEHTYTSDGKLLELCLEIVDQKIDTVKQNWFSYSLQIHYKVDVKWEPMIFSRYSPTEDYEIIFTSDLSTSGIGSKEYKKQQIREFVIRRALDSIVEYGEGGNKKLEDIYANLLD
ncbi:MAG: hypothetical protein P8M34_08635 [Saprospiraceae bacterium]|nr:hypothetical protein [Saprospiraceae bacterium]|tara:strand:- start:1500 stop:2117 length:618 start_codon:yes stop_codon:yes gene_type:complete